MKRYVIVINNKIFREITTRAEFIQAQICHDQICIINDILQPVPQMSTDVIWEETSTHRLHTHSKHPIDNPYKEE